MLKPRILVIDDDESLQRVLRHNLEEEGYIVLLASSGEEGLRLLEEEEAELVITDIRMPGMDGVDVLRRVKELSPQVPVMIITAYGTVETAVEAMRIGAFDYITKPFNRAELKLKVKKALQIKELERENIRLKSELSDKFKFQNIIGSSEKMQKLFEFIKRVSVTDATVLITGESGTGKELVAKAIHYNSLRGEKPFIVVNCSSIPKELLESELFGHLKGSFTGAIKDKPGKFQMAHKGTLFLDEIGDMELGLQAKILRAIQEREVEPVGGRNPIKVDVRIIAATNQNLEEAVRDGRFREDLYYRLNVIPIRLPPLRERKEDIPLLVQYFLQKYSGGKNLEFSREALELLSDYSWPGNVRELENVCERLVILSTGKVINEKDLPEKIREGVFRTDNLMLKLPDEGISLDELEKRVILKALERCDWNQTKAAEFLRVPRHVLLYRLEKFKIIPPSKQ